MNANEVKSWLIKAINGLAFWNELFDLETWPKMIQVYSESKIKKELLDPKKWKHTIQYKIVPNSKYGGYGALGWEWGPGHESWIIPGWEDAIVREFAWVGCPKINPDGDMIRYLIAEKNGKILGVVSSVD